MITRRRRREVVRESETAVQALDRLIREEEDRGAQQEARTASLEDLGFAGSDKARCGAFAARSACRSWRTKGFFCHLAT